MAPKLMLNKFDPVAALFEDLQRGTDERLEVYRALRPEAEDEYGMTMLAHAARAGDSEAVELMLERGADPNAPDRSGRTPLFHVAEGPHDWVSHPEDIVYIVEDLLKYGADVDHADDSGKTASFIAVERGLHPYFVGLARVQERMQARPTARESGTGYTLLHALCDRFCGTDPTQEADALVIAQVLVEHLGIDPNARTSLGRTARALAVARGSLFVAPWLAYGADAFQETERAGRMIASGGATASEAALAGNVRQLRALADLGLISDEPALEGEDEGLTPLSSAASKFAADAVDVLVTGGADPTARLNRKASGGRATEGTSAVRMALWAPNSRVSLPSNVTVEDAKRTLERLLRAPGAADVPVDEEGRTALLTLAQNVDRGWSVDGKDWAPIALDIVLAHGANPDERMPAQGIDLPFCKIPGSVTPLGLLARSGSDAARPLMKKLLAAGANPNATDVTGRTPLAEAANLDTSADAEATVELLLAAGADPSIGDARGETPLSLAAGRGHERVVEMLLAALERLESMRAKDEGNADEAPEEPQNPGPASPASAETPAPQPAAALRRGTEAGGFFERMRARSRTRPTSVGGTSSNAPMAKPVPEAAPKAPAKPAPMPKPVTTDGNADEASRLSVALSRFLRATLPGAAGEAESPSTRSERELRLTAIGLLAAAGGSLGALTRETVALLVDARAAFLLAPAGEKLEPAACREALEALAPFAAVREAGFETVPLATEPGDDALRVLQRFEKATVRWGLPVAAGLLVEAPDDEADRADGRVARQVPIRACILTAASQFEHARTTARLAGLTFVRPSDVAREG
ncbi:ankyrin repeat domain-containing protein [Sutterella megalosphaeroides]|uniref:Uncharacterized protein n=1 Tax=Sutterella megalosphaeroides TaxID=2494234 RepID=A0A2Z6IDQ9_9BURK|nr:ankyrin repeat domain-containing protein [Sutterella megalosphaeroides]BBF23288.1 hypothetical protein SUTMEG_11790 [Sutterella megalosphaeroides]